MKRYLPLLLGFMMWITALAAIGVSVSEAAPIEVGSGGSAPAYENSCHAYGSGFGPAVFWKDPDGLVHLEGEVLYETGYNTPCFTLPVGFRPAYNLQLPSEAGGFGSVEVHPSGEVDQVDGSARSVSYAGMSFLAEGASAEWSSVEGKEGKEGKEGPEGKEGKEGKEGLEGHEGKEGVSGEGGGGKVELVSFGNEAQNTLSELKETDETIGWCVIGTLLALALGFMVYKILGPGRR